MQPILEIMGLFGNLFSKEPKKEKLEEGLEKTKNSVFSKLSKAVAGKSRVDDAVNATHEMQVINVSELLNGTYILEMKNADETLYTAKFVVLK